MKRERSAVETEKGEKNKVFYLLRDYFSNPEVLIIVASDLKSAEELLNKRLEEENDIPGSYGKLTELDLSNTTITTLSPPGDHHLIR